MSLFFQLYISQVTTLESVDYESVPKRHPPPPTTNSAVISCTKLRVHAWNIRLKRFYVFVFPSFDNAILAKEFDTAI